MTEACAWLQFGSGRFLRAFADLFIHQANLEGQDVGRIVVVQTTGDQRARVLNQQQGRYHVLVRGISKGKVVDSVLESASIVQALSAADDWRQVLTLARSPNLRHVISNTSEVGYKLDPGDAFETGPPRSFPAKLLHVLYERFRAQQQGVAVLPCELIEHNAEVLRGIILRMAQEWQIPAAFSEWLQTKCFWHNCLVDRIVANAPADHPMTVQDPLTSVAEPYAFWAIEILDGSPFVLRHPAIVMTRNVDAFFLRKVRILNAAHTAMLSQALPRGFKTVREAVLDPAIGAWLRRLLFEEIVPVVAGRVDDAKGFAEQVLERFANPFLEHQLRDIATNHEAKAAIRLEPTAHEYEQMFGRRPPLLDAALAWRPA